MSNSTLNLVTLRAGIVAQFVGQLGPQREADAEWLGDQMLKHFEALTAAGSAVIAATPSDITTPEQLNERLREHNREFLEAATGAVLVAMQQAVGLALHGRPRRGG